MRNLDSANFAESRPKSAESTAFSNIDSANLAYEIIVVENCDDFNATSPTQAFLTKYYKGKISYYKNKRNLGLFGNFNQCLKLAKGKWVCILHDDDILLPNYLEKMSQAVQDVAPNTSLISSRPIFFGNLDLFEIQKENTKTFKYYLKTHWDRTFRALKAIKNAIIFSALNIKTYKYLDTRNATYIANFNPLHPSCMLHNRELCLKLGGYNQSYFPSDDWYFHTRAAMHSNVYQINEFLSKYRLANNTSFNKNTMRGFGILDYYFVRDCMQVGAKMREILLQKHYLRVMKFGDDELIDEVLSHIKLTPKKLSFWDELRYKMHRMHEVEIYGSE
ncbi:glycosyltransferase family 2 protein [Helicobacter sp. 23-1044]